MAKKNSLSRLIAGQAEVLFLNADTAFASLPASNFGKKNLGYPYWMHFYHMLHSMDQWLINPFKFKEPPFHARGLDSFPKNPQKHLTRGLLLKYYFSIRSKVRKYLKSLDDTMLAEKPEGCRYTRLEMIIAANRHFMYHVGFIHACIKNDSGKWPEYKGLSNPLTRI